MDSKFILDDIVYATRELLACSREHTLEMYTNPEIGDHIGLCGYSSALTYYTLRYFGIDKKDIFTPNVGLVWDSGCHSFIVVRLNDELYIIDLTLSQFELHSIQNVQKWLNIINRGYFKVTLGNLQEYSLITSGDNKRIVDKEIFTKMIQTGSLDWNLEELTPYLNKCMKSKPEMVNKILNELSP